MKNEKNEIKGNLEILGEGQVINNKPYHKAIFTDKHKNKYNCFICVFSKLNEV